MNRSSCITIWALAILMFAFVIIALALVHNSPTT